MVGRLSIVDILLGLSVPLIWGMGIVFAKGAIENFPPILLMTLNPSLKIFRRVAAAGS